MNKVTIYIQLMATLVEKQILALQKSITKTFTKKEEHILALEEKLEARDKRIKELEAQLKGKPKPQPTKPQEPKAPEEPPTPDNPGTPEPQPEPEPIPKPDLPGLPHIRKNIRSTVNFNSKDLPQGWRTQVYTAHGYRIVDLPGFGRAARLELNADDKRISSQAVRAEINTLHGVNEHMERWGYSLYFPSEYWKEKDTWAIVSQFHNDQFKGEPVLSPPIALFVQDGLFQVSINYGDVRKPVQKRFELGPVILDQKVDIYWFVLYSDNQTTDKNDPKCGNLALRINGKLLIDYWGPTKYSGHKENPYFKVGVYQRSWKAKNKKRVIYVGQIRQGEKDSTFKDVVPD